jgi:hypothetical protein
LEDAITNHGWISKLDERGFWPMLYMWNNGFPYKGLGTEPWLQGIGSSAMYESYRVLNDTTATGCNNPTLAASVLTAYGKSVDFMHEYGQGANFGMYYTVEYETQGQMTTNGPGTVSITQGSPSVTGVGTTFLTTFACNGSDYFAPRNGYSDDILRVASCESDTSLTLVSNAAHDASGIQYLRTLETNKVCESKATYCEGTPDKGVMHLPIANYGRMYRLTGDPKYKLWGDATFASDYGTPGEPGAEATRGNFNDAIIYGPAYAGWYGKQYGESAGIGAAQTYLAFRSGSQQPPEEQTVEIVVDPTSVPNAASVRVNITRPSGQLNQTTCTSSPCRVKVDAREGAHLMKLEYLSTSGAVLASSKPTQLSVTRGSVR